MILIILKNVKMLKDYNKSKFKELSDIGQTFYPHIYSHAGKNDHKVHRFMEILDHKVPIR